MIHAVLAWALLAEPAPLSIPAPPDADADADADRLGEIVVDAEAVPDPNRLPVVSIGTAGPRASATRSWFRVVRNDLELYGGFELRDTSIDEDGGWLVGAQAGVALVGLDDDDGLRVVVRVYGRNGRIIWEKAIADAPGDAHDAHVLTDAVLEALTGLRGGFASRLAFARTIGAEQHAWVMDVDGANAKKVSRGDELVVSPTFDTDGRLVYAASVDHGRYRIRVAEDRKAGADLGGSVYGIAFSPDGSRAAVSVARGDGIHLLVGTSGLGDLRRANAIELAMHPAFGPDGRLAFVGEVAGRPRVFVGERAVSSPRAVASAPEFCHHPTRPRLVWAERTGDRWVLVRADVDGRRATRVSAGWGDARWPACSPDGRMVAFVSDGRGRERGIWVTHVEHFGPRRVTGMVGSALHWSGWR